jgi:uncharacterized YccA/Bax inhibitor family protein
VSRNPILTDSAFDPANFGGSSTATMPSPSQEWDSAQASQAASAGGAAAAGAMTTGMTGRMPSVPVTTGGRTMTMGGVASATFLFLMIVGVGAVFGWMSVTETKVLNPAPGQPTATAEFNSVVLLIVALFVALGFALVTSFKPNLARFTGFGYAIAEGYVLGAISHYYNTLWNGIVLQAVLGTAGVFLAMLALYGFRVLRVTPKMTKAIIGATFGVFFLYLIGWVISLFSSTPSFMSISGGGTFGILMSLVIVGIAAFNLLLDFDFIENGTKSGLPAYMDWYGAFGLLVTLVWIYIEMLRLLARLRSN